jgi:hypothetical protein
MGSVERIERWKASSDGSPRADGPWGACRFRCRRTPHAITHHRSPQQYGSEDMTLITTDAGSPWFTTPREIPRAVREHADAACV